MKRQARLLFKKAVDMNEVWVKYQAGLRRGART
jgi:hypothetical protein